MEPAYFETLFRVTEDWDTRPPEFAIITAYATTGQTWSDEANRSADQQMHLELSQRCSWLRRITGYSPHTDHQEPGWAADLTFHAACDLGVKYHQDAIYFVEHDQLFVSKCDAQLRSLIEVGLFSPRIVKLGNSASSSKPEMPF